MNQRNATLLRAELILLVEKYAGPVESGYDIKNAVEDHAHDSAFAEFHSEGGPSMAMNAASVLTHGESLGTQILYVAQRGYPTPGGTRWIGEFSDTSIALVKAFLEQFQVRPDEQTRLVKITKTETLEVV